MHRVLYCILFPMQWMPVLLYDLLFIFTWRMKHMLSCFMNCSHMCSNYKHLCMHNYTPDIVQHYNILLLMYASCTCCVMFYITWLTVNIAYNLYHSLLKASNPCLKHVKVIIIWYTCLLTCCDKITKLLHFDQDKMHVREIQICLKKSVIFLLLSCDFQIP